MIGSGGSRGCRTIAVALGITIIFGALAAAQIGKLSGYAWGTNIGWINFAPQHGGVSAHDDHLEGYAWGENVGWLRLGTYEGGGSHTYGNTTAADYGVNRDPSGKLFGYAWGTNIGWINFAPTHGGVSIGPADGRFVGYAWGENVGWIRFGGSGYDVQVGKGDINGDGKVDLLDARLCLQIADGVLAGTAVQRSAADVDGDGDVDMDDAVALAEYVIGARDTLP